MRNIEETVEERTQSLEIDEEHAVKRDEREKNGEETELKGKRNGKGGGNLGL